MPAMLYSFHINKFSIRVGDIRKSNSISSDPYRTCTWVITRCQMAYIDMTEHSLTEDPLIEESLTEN